MRRRCWWLCALGATTQNITQTGLLLLLRQAHDIFLQQLASLLDMLADLAERTKSMLIPGRTHGQHAVPATFGFKVAVWIDEFCRHVERLRACEGRVFVAMLGGGAGTVASLGEQGPPTQAKMAQRLGLGTMRVRARWAIMRQNTSVSWGYSLPPAAKSGGKSTPS